MGDSFFERHKSFLYSIIPFGATLLAIILVILPVRFLGSPGVSPALPLICVFFWAFQRPEGIPEPSLLLAVFGLGLYQDLLGSGEIGLNAIVFLSLFAGVASQVRFFRDKPFFVIFYGFVIVVFLALFTEWLFTSLLYQLIFDPMPVLIQFMLTVLFFPAVFWLLTQMQYFVKVVF